MFNNSDNIIKKNSFLGIISLAYKRSDATRKYYISQEKQKKCLAFYFTVI